MKRNNLKKVDNYKIITIFLFIIFIFTSFSMKSQNIYTMSVSPNGSNSIDVNLEVYETEYILFVDSYYVITGNEIKLKVCYEYAPLFQFSLLNNTFNIPILNNSNYSLIVETYRTNLTVTCDYSNQKDSATIQFATPLTGTVALASDNFELNKKTITIFPNPVSEKLYFTNNNLVIDKIEIYNILGEKVKIVNHDFENIFVSNLINGIYFVVFNTDIGVVSKKILIQN